ncbi:NRDE family protein [Caldimonas sp. KR1-144]|uniref:NRDE family protein n=1 Tax=Caldimonas sp. KR1-144 TaxID=3400911 RepID=UPI003C026425
MCLVALAVGASGRFPFVLASNRDEFYDRDAAPLDWWTPEGGSVELLGGRDLRAGGTWLGLSAAGRLAFVTNVRDPSSLDPTARSRGELVTRWIEGDPAADARGWWSGFDPSRYNGFNLIAGDAARGELFWAGRDRHGAHGPVPLARGIHGVSNAALDTPWPKVKRLKSRLSEAMSSAVELDALAASLFEALADARIAPDAELPRTGVPQEVERWLSAAFIRSPDGRYGTRCSTLVITERGADGLATHVIERSHAPGTPAERHMTIGAWPEPQAGAERRP